MTAFTRPIPAVSVVMSCFNAEKWLNESIDSILNQTWCDFEFILIDDGSVDKTRKIIEEYAARDERIKPIIKSNTGLADSLNVGISRARGHWIARLDADDISDPSRLEKQFRLAYQSTNVVYVGSGCTLIDEQGRRLSVHTYPSTHKKLVKYISTFRKFPPHSSAFFRTDAFNYIGGYRGEFIRAEDWDLWLRLSEIGQLRAIRAPLVRIRKHQNQISHHEGGMRQVYDANRAIVSYLIRRKGHHDPFCDERFENWLTNRLQEENVYDIINFSTRLRQQNNFNKIFVLLYLAKKMYLNPSLIWQYVRKRFAGSAVPRRIAREWIEITKKRRS